MRNTIWFMDIDGSINIRTPIQTRHLSMFPDYREITLPLKDNQNYVFRYSPTVVDKINQISQYKDTRLLTSWSDEDLHTLSSAIGLGNFQVMRGEGESHPQLHPHVRIDDVDRNWWKFKIIMNHIDSLGADFVWSDDELNASIRPFIKRMANFEGIENMLIAPNPDLGFTPTELSVIDGFSK